MKIAMLGLQCYDANKGCEALTYSFITILKAMNIGELELHSYGYSELGQLPDSYPEIRFVFHRLHLKKPTYWLKLKKEFDKMDLIVDMTFGDGFSDIYGKKWNIITNLAKNIAVKSNTPFVLLPQTYGPFFNPLLKKWGYYLVKKSDYAFSRDDISAFELNKIIGEKVIETTDLAFALGYDKKMYKLSENKKVGINVSALLWFSGHNDTIKLKTDYRKYIYSVIEYMESNDYEIHLIPHVVDNNYNSPENDVRACDEVHELFPHTIIAPRFENPIQAKSYIANMDVFIGARMHSTIASFSTGVLTIPFAYSKKFEGLFGNLNYKYIIDGVNTPTSESIESTMDYISKKDIIKLEQEKSMKFVSGKMAFLKQTIKEILLKNNYE